MASDPSVSQQNDETATAILRQKKRYVARSLTLAFDNRTQLTGLNTIHSPNKLIVDDRSTDDSSGESTAALLVAMASMMLAPDCAYLGATIPHNTIEGGNEADNALSPHSTSMFWYVNSRIHEQRYPRDTRSVQGRYHHLQGKEAQGYRSHCFDRRECRRGKDSNEQGCVQTAVVHVNV